MADFLLKRVLWRDGDVISENHFKAQEDWTENYIGLSNQLVGKYGYFRNTILQDTYNRTSNISFHFIEGSQYRIDLEKIQVINPFGKVFKIDDKISLNLNIQLFKRDSEGYILVYLLPVTDSNDISDLIDRNSDEIQTGLKVYSPIFEISTSNTKGDGVPIIRFKVLANHLDIDESFIPYGIFINSTSASQNAHLSFFDKYSRFSDLVSDYFLSHSSRPGLPFIWELATNLYRITENFKTIFAVSDNSTQNFILELQRFISVIKAEINIFTIGFDQDYYRQAYQNLIEVLDAPIVKQVELQTDLTFLFEKTDIILDELIKYLAILPEGLDTEKTLAIDRVELRKVAGSNKLTVFLESEVEFKQGETLMSIELHSYSQSEPVSKNVRVSLGDVAQAMLKDLVNALKPIKGESLSYRIECPKDIINRSRASIITLYLPTPIGENVPDLKKYISIKVRG